MIVLHFSDCTYEQGFESSHIMHLSIVGPTIPPLGQCVGKSGDLIKQVIKYPTIWAGQVIKSPPDPCS